MPRQRGTQEPTVTSVTARDVRCTTRQRGKDEKLGGSVYPVLTLPNEITSEIFVSCLPEHGRVRATATEAPLSLLHVCRLWRNIAVAIPELWCSLDVTLACAGGRDTQIKTEKQLILPWFTRAGNRPLSLTIRQAEWYNRTYENDDIPPFLQEYIPKLRRLEADVSHRQLLQLIPADIELEQLEELAAPLEGESLAEIFQRAPNLKRLQIRDLCSEDASKLSSSSLTSLHLDSYYRITLIMFLDVLDRCPSLTQFTGGVVTTQACVAKHSQTSQVEFPNLTSLVLKSYCWIDAPDPHWMRVLSFVTLQNLETLRFGLAGTSSLPIVSSFLSRSANIITRLTLATPSISDFGAIISCLQLFPDVETLEIEYYSKCFRTVDFPGLCGDDLASMTKLRELTLRLHVESEIAIDYDTIYDIVTHRHEDPALASLNSFRIRVVNDEDVNSNDQWLPPKTYAAQLTQLIPSFSLEVLSGRIAQKTPVTRWPVNAPIDDPLSEFFLHDDISNSEDSRSSWDGES